jgi:hypothetical protein
LPASSLEGVFLSKDEEKLFRPLQQTKSEKSNGMQYSPGKKKGLEEKLSYASGKKDL